MIYIIDETDSYSNISHTMSGRRGFLNLIMPFTANKKHPDRANIISTYHFIPILVE